ncbi:hypothetical protein CPB83DRAFT_116200 [Crepidotus variabilis]|uniref:BTB domain-containing protein n=1 Tax=Crepidotus variabilis TaxID=179855 RepID=A0A9P6E4C3_9AGAR|nr:hypothetical protein CPB83DRAFT_116200 [Crepidotus variabilis]
MVNFELQFINCTEFLHLVSIKTLGLDDIIQQAMSDSLEIPTSEAPSSPTLRSPNISQIHKRGRRRKVPWDAETPLVLKTPTKIKNKSSHEPERSTKTRKATHDQRQLLLTDNDIYLKIEETHVRCSSRTLARESPFFDYLLSCRDNRQPPESFPEFIGDFNTEDMVGYIVADRTKLDDLDVFSLSPLQGPSLDEFMALYEAFDRSIEYAMDLPKIEQIAQIYSAANFYGAERYEDFCIKAFRHKLYQDDLAKLSEKPLSFAPVGVRLGRLPKSCFLRRRAFYDLARYPGSDPIFQKRMHHELAALELLGLINLQKQLSKAWDQIPELLSYPDKEYSHCTDCHEPRHRGSYRLVQKIRAELPFDPLIGIRELRDYDWGAKGFCSAAALTLEGSLEERARSIWGNINIWIDVSLNADAGS